MNNDLGEPQAHREIGDLFSSEAWWRDRYRDLENHGYKLRPRYHPDWQPSWKASGKAFFLKEDGQASVVSTIYLTRATLMICVRNEQQWTGYEYRITNK
jgi:hypothetical protein